MLRDPLYRTGLINSVGVAVFTTLLCLLIAMPLAMLAAKFEFFGKTLLSSLVLVPLILPPFVGAIGLRAILGRFGSLNALLGDVGVLSAQQPGVDFLGGELGGRFWAVVVMQALHLYRSFTSTSRRRWRTSTRRWTKRRRGWGPVGSSVSCAARCR